jgi:5-(carboxyamino)imidazole ribonucleotide mutase
MSENNEVLVAVIMGSKSDWDTMSAAAELLGDFGVAHECRVLSAHRTPHELMEYLSDAEARGCEVFIGGAGGAAHLPGVIASQTVRPVLGVPITSALQGLDSMLSIAQMPEGIPVGCMAIGTAGATNAALLAVAILGTSRPDLLEKIRGYRKKRAEKILGESLPKSSIGFKK